MQSYSAIKKDHHYTKEIGEVIKTVLRGRSQMKKFIPFI